MIKADLHIHSNVSDGSSSIEEIIEVAQSKKLDIIAITDHDTTSHFAKIPADTRGIIVIPGVELSAICYQSNMRAHILGYDIKEPAVITALTQPLLEARNENSEKQVEVLKSAGFSIDEAKLARADGKYLYKQHIMDWLVTTGQAPDMFGTFYQKIFKHGGICDFDIEYLNMFDAVHAIKQAGGLAVLAHPGKQQNTALIPKLVHAGLDGLELNHHTHSEQDRVAIKDYAWRYDLVLTGGSDYHGRYEPQPYGIGDFLSPPSGIKALQGHSFLQQVPYLDEGEVCLSWQMAASPLA
ncbi:MAG: PHP domain-containing protein [Coriobacteriia bacterium]|nr:PHP domain-containing protein [Coriobacteriia bacterium]